MSHDVLRVALSVWSYVFIYFLCALGKIGIIHMHVGMYELLMVFIFKHPSERESGIIILQMENITSLKF